MKFLTIIAALLASAGAYAADLPVKAQGQAVPYVTGDAFSGVYLGIHGGYGWNNGDASNGIGPVSISALQTAPQGFVGGLHLGAGQRVGQIWYIGAEADIDIATLDGTSSNLGLISSTSKNNLLGSLRARFGVIPVGHALIYGTAGYGFGTAQFTVSDPINSATIKPTMGGLTWGGGVELPFSANWIGRIEYLQYDFNSANVATPAVTLSVKDRVDVVRAGLSYRF